MKSLFLPTLLTILLIVLNGCKEEVIEPEVSDTITLANEVEVFSDEFANNILLEYEEETGKLHYSDNLAKNQSSITSYFISDNPGDGILEEEDIIVIPPNSTTPYGCLRRIKAVESKDGKQILTTEQAYLDELVGKGRIEQSYTYTQNDVKAMYSYSKTGEKTLYKGNNYDIFSIELDHEISLYPKNLTKEQTIEVTGLIELSLGLDFILDTEAQITTKEYNLPFGRTISAPESIEPKVNEFEFALRADFINQAKVRFSGDLLNDVKYSYKVAEYELEPIEFAIGPVPVWITNTVPINLEFHISPCKKDSFVVSVVKNCSYRIGLNYSSGNTTLINEFTMHDHPTLSYSDPGDSFSAKINDNCSIQSKLYSVAGPFIALERYVKLDLNTQNQLHIKKTAGAKAHIGAVLGFKGFTLFKYDQDIDILKLEWD